MAAFFITNKSLFWYEIKLHAARHFGFGFSKER